MTEFSRQSNENSRERKKEFHNKYSKRAQIIRLVNSMFDSHHKNYTHTVAAADVDSRLPIYVYDALTNHFEARRRACALTAMSCYNHRHHHHLLHTTSGRKPCILWCIMPHTEKTGDNTGTTTLLRNPPQPALSSSDHAIFQPVSCSQILKRKCSECTLRKYFAHA